MAENTTFLMYVTYFFQCFSFEKNGLFLKILQNGFRKKIPTAVDMRMFSMSETIITRRVALNETVCARVGR